MFLLSIRPLPRPILMRRLAKLAVLFLGSSLLLRGMAFALSLWLARSLSIHDFAQWGLLYAVQTGLGAFGTVGIVEAVISLQSRQLGTTERLRIYSAAVPVFHISAALSALIAITILGAIWPRFREDFFSIITAVASGVLLAYALLQSQLVRLDERHMDSLYFSFGMPSFGLLCSGAAFFFRGTVESFYVASTLGLLLAMGICRTGRIGFSGESAGRPERMEILSRVPPYVVIALFGWLSGYGNNLVIGAFFEAEQIARYTFAMSVGTMLQLIATSLNQVWGPRFYRIVHSESFAEVERKNRHFFALQSIVLGCIGGAILALLPAVLPAFGGNLEYYSTMRWELFFIMIAYVCLTPWWHCNNYYLAYDKGRNVRDIVLVTSAIGLGTWFLLMYSLGELGIYAGFFVQMLIRSVGIFLFARRNWAVEMVWPSIAAGGLIVFGGLLFPYQR